MNKLMVYLLCALIAFAPACSVLTPKARDAAIATIQEEFAGGHLTRAQYDAAMEALMDSKPFDWETLGIVGVNIVLALVGAPAIVRLQRGKPTQLAGLPASKIQQGV